MCPHFIWIYMLTYMKIQYIYYRVFENKNCFFFLHKIKILFLPFVIACCQHKTFEQLTGHSIPSGSKCGDNFHPQIWNLAASLAGILNGKMKVWASLWKLWLASFDGRVRKQYNFSGKPCTKITSNALFPCTFKTHLARLCELVNNVQTNTCRTD